MIAREGNFHTYHTIYTADLFCAVCVLILNMLFMCMNGYADPLEIKGVGRLKILIT